ncbi:MAG: hypothetical protein JW822_05025 [Spirochaetales bacterium]|nr:hypothetical protein [Spirochaetales bacterium]
MMKTQNNFRFIIAVVLVSYVAASCQTNDQNVLAQNNMQAADRQDLFPIYNTCVYNQFPGQAHILSVNWINDNYVELTFNFFLSDPGLKIEYRFPRMGDTGRKKAIYIDTEQSGTIKLKLRVGDVIPCLRSEIIKGTCTPVVFTFPDLES